MKDNGKFTSIKASERVTGFPHMINFAGTCCRKWHRTLQLKPPRTSMSLHILAIIMVHYPLQGLRLPFSLIHGADIDIMGCKEGTVQRSNEGLV